jgi:class 3 adenylate cyclase
MGDTLARIKALAAAGEVLLSQHAYDRLAENGMSAADIGAGIAGALEIEDHKGPSVLVLQADANGQPIHVLWGIRKGTMAPAIVVTAYRPDPSRWTTDFRRRL